MEIIVLQKDNIMLKGERKKKKTLMHLSNFLRYSL